MRRYAPVRTMDEEKFLDSPLPACLTTSKGSGQPHFRGSPFLHLCHPERSLRSRRISTGAPAAGVRNANLYSIEGVGSARFFGFPFFKEKPLHFLGFLQGKGAKGLGSDMRALEFIDRKFPTSKHK